MLLSQIASRTPPLSILSFKLAAEVKDRPRHHKASPINPSFIKEFLFLIFCYKE
jgi:hypothetical protein